MNEYIAALVDEFHQLGVRHAVFSPGSRSTTMAMLFTEHEGFTTYMNIDEPLKELANNGPQPNQRYTRVQLVPYEPLQYREP